MTTAPGAGSYQDFLRRHGPRFEEVVHVPGAVPGPAHLRQLLNRAVRAGMESPARGIKLRAFTGSTLDYRLHKELQNRPLREDREVAEWIASVGGPSACVAINGLAAWDLALGTWFVERVADIAQASGVALTSKQDSYAFISAGDGWTPFGIHEDYEPSFIFHLGPNPKRVWFWEEPERPVGVAASVPAFGGVSFRIEDSLPSAREICLQPGDFLSIPAHVYHVFRNEGPSAFIGLAVHFPDEQRDALAAVRSMARRLLERHPLGTGASAVESLSVLLAEHGRELADDWQRGLADLTSAGFVERPDRGVLESLPPARGPYRVPHPTLLQARGDSLHVRGSALRLGLAAESVERLRAQLVAAAEIDRHALAAGLDVTPRTAERLLTAIYELGGLVTA